ncbi:hypothetical protein [Paraburkholderia humisilvae]|uniref:Uncharacterized protein n=1 Tax=Paraburkholderia humisilvae TaxID=627669 RepID=A0A6J5DJK2_9BURK|nr:hypothetical protein [Paraburkholderia humisilvae]CAB3754123.1 hypothetical protein LMG29542_02256 [Paraburkholderia humisilvae]
MQANELPIWVIYDKPSDIPDWFVARKWFLDRPTSELRLGRTLDEVRAKLPAGLYRLPRDPSDDAKIVESWI